MELAAHQSVVAVSEHQKPEAGYERWIKQHTDDSISTGDSSPVKNEIMTESNGFESHLSGSPYGSVVNSGHVITYIELQAKTYCHFSLLRQGGAMFLFVIISLALVITSLKAKRRRQSKKKGVTNRTCGNFGALEEVCLKREKFFSCMLPVQITDVI